MPPTNCSIPHRFALLMTTLAHWPGDSRNYHALRASILSCKIFTIYDNSPVVSLFHVIVIVFSLFMIIFVINLANKRDIKLKYRQKSSFLLFCEIFLKALPDGGLTAQTDSTTLC